MVKGAAVAEQPTGTPRLTLKRVEDNSDELVVSIQLSALLQSDSVPFRH